MRRGRERIRKIKREREQFRLKLGVKRERERLIEIY